MNAAKSWTEAEVVELINFLECRNCLDRDPIADLQPTLDGGTAIQITTIEEARALVPDCGCDDPIGNPIILVDAPLFEVEEIDQDYKIVGRRLWEYDVSEDLWESLLEAGVAQ